MKGKTNIDVANTLSALSYNEYRIQYRAKKEYQEAIQQAEEAMAIVKKHSGPDNILIVEPKRTIAVCTQDIARKKSGEEKEKLLNMSLEAMQDCLKIRQVVLGQYNPATTVMMSNVGSILEDLGRDKEAEKLLQSSLTIQWAILGLNDKEVERTNNFLAVLNKNHIGNFPMAEKHVLESRRIKLKLYGPS